MNKKEQVLIYEKFYGVVKHVGKNTAVIVFEIDNDLVEYTYSSYQFINGLLPDKGALVAVITLITELPEKNDENTNKRISRPGKHISGPLEL